MAGVEQRAFDTAFQRFTRRSAEAAGDTGVLAKEFKALGIGFTNSNGGLKTSEELFREYADAIKNTANPAEKLRLAFAAFDT
ncbi:hypothetical protein ACMAZE_12695 [Pseudopelagicola sp. nBUS_20]|uniref:hypothetical protein n=1 Tax=Pseudopelagicola sp. nBUS_20 TaxID=3395317 RepID=UPI003EBA3D86